MSFKNIWLGKTSPIALMFLEFEWNGLYKLLKEENSWRVKSQELFEIWKHSYKGLVFKGTQSIIEKSGNRSSSKSSIYIPVNVCLGSSQSSTHRISEFFALTTIFQSLWQSCPAWTHLHCLLHLCRLKSTRSCKLLGVGRHL